MLFLIYTEIPCKLLLLALKEYFEIIMNLYQILLVIYIYIERVKKVLLVLCCLYINTGFAVDIHVKLKINQSWFMVYQAGFQR